MGAAGSKRAGGAAGTVAKHRLCFQPPGQDGVPKRARCSLGMNSREGLERGHSARKDSQPVCILCLVVPTRCVGSSQKPRAGQPHPSHSVWG